MELVEVLLNDPVESWTRAGFTVTKEAASKELCIQLENPQSKHGFFLIRFLKPYDPSRPRGVVAWGWHGDRFQRVPNFVGNLPSYNSNHRYGKQPKHANHIHTVDHIVVHVPDQGEAMQRDLAQLGVTLGKERKDVYPGVTQQFYRSGTIIEVIVGMKRDGESQALTAPHIWGMTLVSRDLDGTKSLLGEEGASKIKGAVQGGGRRIMTLRHAHLKLGTNIAVMSPHEKTPKAERTGEVEETPERSKI